MGNFFSFVLNNVTRSFNLIILSSNFNFFISLPLCMYSTQSNWWTRLVCSLQFLFSLTHDLLHLSEGMSKVSIFGNDLHVRQTRIIHCKELKSQRAEEINASFCVRIWNWLTIFQEKVVDHILNVIHIVAIRAATLQTLGVTLESSILRS